MVDEQAMAGLWSFSIRKGVLPVVFGADVAKSCSVGPSFLKTDLGKADKDEKRPITSALQNRVSTWNTHCS
jgi:hypothetical protein